MAHMVGGETRLSYSEAISTSKAHYINLVKDLSWVNSRGMEHTDRDGHVVGYIVDLTIVLDGAAPWTLSSAPNSWKMRNAFRKWHFARLEMFRNAGVSKSEMGKYGQTIRPFLEQNMVNYDSLSAPVEKETLVPLGCTDGARTWTYSDVVSAPGFQTSETGSGGLSMTDAFKLTICDENKTEATATGGTTLKFSTAGMIHSYNIDRMEVTTPTALSSIIGENNPLAALRSQTVTAGEVTEVAEDQETEAPPYDLSDAGDSIDKVFIDFLNTNTATLQVARVYNLFVPAGILSILQSSGGTVTPAIFIDVKGSVLCKDVA
jgi:hypothetical protein